MNVLQLTKAASRASRIAPGNSITRRTQWQGTQVNAWARRLLIGGMPWDCLREGLTSPFKAVGGHPGRETRAAQLRQRHAG
jgi:hypothetical protein